ncbi:MAG TPA: hypothetical protein H9675_04750 [Firmicutes bacterium]|nr:hypothetical protein [Bacillota bacterium]
MIKQLIAAIEPLGYPIFLQGSLNDNEAYPESFFTYWNFQANDTKAFDNDASICEWGYWLYFYSSNPALVETEILRAKELLKKAGFEVWGKGEDIKSDVISHTGRMITAYFYENY